VYENDNDAQLPLIRLPSQPAPEIPDPILLRRDATDLEKASNPFILAYSLLQDASSIENVDESASIPTQQAQFTGVFLARLARVVIGVESLVGDLEHTVGSTRRAIAAAERGDVAGVMRHSREGINSAQSFGAGVITPFLPLGRVTAGSDDAVKALSTAADDALAPLRAEALGGERIWYVGPEGASSTFGVRFRGNLITYDTTASAAASGVRRDMKVISNTLGGETGIWVTGTHGTSAGAFGGQHLEPRFFRSERQFGQYYGWDVVDVATTGIPLNPCVPTVLNWCFSSAGTAKPPISH